MLPNVNVFQILPIIVGKTKKELIEKMVMEKL